MEARRFLRLDRYWCVEVAESLLKRIDELVALKPKAALELAEIAIELVQRIRGASRTLHAHAHCSLAVTQRFVGRLQDAEANFRAADRNAVDGPLILRTMIARQKALLLNDQGHYEAALELVRSAIQEERRIGQFPSRSLVCEAVILGDRREFATAAQLCSEVLEMEDPGSAIYTSAMQNLAAAMASRPLFGSEIVSTRKLLHRVRERIRGIRYSPIRYAVWYTEALLHIELEEFRLAIPHLRSARMGFLRLDMLQHYADVSADLATVHSRRNEEESVKRIIVKTLSELTQAGADEKLLNPFRQAEKESDARLAVEHLTMRRAHWTA